MGRLVLPINFYPMSSSIQIFELGFIKKQIGLSALRSLSRFSRAASPKSADDHMCNLEMVKTYEGTDHIHTLVVIGERVTGIAAYK